MNARHAFTARLPLNAMLALALALFAPARAAHAAPGSSQGWAGKIYNSARQGYQRLTSASPWRGQGSRPNGNVAAEAQRSKQGAPSIGARSWSAALRWAGTQASKPGQQRLGSLAKSVFSRASKNVQRLLRPLAQGSTGATKQPGSNKQADTDRASLQNEERALGSAGGPPVRSGNPLPGQGINRAFIVHTVDGKMRVFKPRYGEKRQKGVSAFPLYKREVMASEISELLGLGIVPKTQVMKVSKGEAQKINGMKKADVGSAQDFVRHFTEAENFHFEPGLKRDLLKNHWPRLVEMAAFDDIIGNTDRHAGNWGVDAKGKPYFIDNGGAFSKYGKADIGARHGLNGQFAVLSSQVLPITKEKLRADPHYQRTIQSFRANQKAIRAIFKRYGLPKKEQKAFFARIENTALGRFH